MTTPPHLVVLLLAQGDHASPHQVDAWQELAAHQQVPVAVVDGDEDWWTTSPVLEGLAGDDLVVLADASWVPGPDLLDRLRSRHRPGAVVDARVLPVEVVRVDDPRRPHARAEPGDPHEQDDLADRVDSLAPELRVSGACCAVEVAALASVGRFWRTSVLADRGRLLSEWAAAGGHDIVVEPTATVFLDIRVDADGLPLPAPDASARQPVEEYEPPASLHPAALPATSLGSVLAAVGLPWTDPDDDAVRDRPFLSIVTRTQGRRSQCLEEVLTCLAGQTDRDFEVLVMCHRVDDEARAGVLRIVAALPGWLRPRVRTIDVERPGRAAPLNDGFEAARGRYIAMLDDDDTVLAHWVETFAGLEREAAGRLLRAATVRQDVVPLGGHEQLCAVPVGNNIREWPLAFELIDHLRANYSPCMSMAFPRGVFHHLGFRFDETLDTTEDWDFLVRTAGMVGACSSPEVTSVYRWWLDQASSREVHTNEEWDEARKRVEAKIDQSVILLPPGAAKRLREAVEEGWDEAAEVATSQHKIILEMNKTAVAHDQAVANWQAAEARVEAARAAGTQVKEKLAKRTQKFQQQLALMRKVENRIREGSLPPTDGAVADLSMSELRALLATPTVKSGRRRSLRSLAGRRPRS